VTKKEKAQHSKGKRLENSEWKEWNEKYSSSNTGNEKESIHRKWSLVGKVEG